jgi:hypothetical protein
MNVPATVPTSLPAHLAKLTSNTALMGINQSVAGGISSGGFPRISTRGGMFRLLTPSQDELVLQTRFADVIVLDANPYISKVYYSKMYNPTAGDDEAPDCYSDNGVAPSQSAKKPQCGTCAACPHNVWGSKISENGNQTKACTDYKKLAVFMADNTGGPVFEFKIPPASLKHWLAYVKSLDSAGIPVCSVVTRISFNPNEVNVLTFEPAGLQQSGQLPYITAEQMEDVLSVAGTDEVLVCIGGKDKPFDPARLAAPQTAPAPQPTALPPMPATVTAPGPVQAPAAPVPTAVLPGTPVVPPVGAAPQPGTKRTRKPKGPEQQMQLPSPPNAAPMVQDTAPQPMTVPPILQNYPPAQPVNNAVNNAAPLNPPVANASLDALLAAAMAK